MQRLRTRWAQWMLVATMIASLLPLVASPVAPEDFHRVPISYAQWLRAQMQGPATPAVEAALAAAEEAGARSPYAFVSAFVEAYERANPDGDLAEVFSTLHLSREALVAYLQGQIARVVGQGLLPRVLLWSATTIAGSSSTKGATYADAAAPRAAAWHVEHLTPAMLEGAIVSIRRLCAAQPLGP